jgi:tRNA A-37 threonylcarbamoyl transferase component Bud32
MPLLRRKGPVTGSAPDPTQVLLGHVFEGRYQIDRQIGQGGIGVVYAATDTKLKSRTVAVKVLSDKMGARKKQRRRFEREAKALAALSHPNIVSIIDYGVADHTPYLVMELLDGKPLSRIIADEAPLEPERALRLMGQLLAGLAYAHDRSIVHRDLKPGNLFVQVLPGVGERVKLLDFGLAKFLDPADDSTLTASGEIFGTPGYMPPEQMLGKPVDTRADVYSACVILYEMLAGQKPFGSVLAEVVQRQLNAGVPTLADAGTGRTGDEKLEALLARGMAVDVEARFRDAHELASAVGKLSKSCVRKLSDEERARLARGKHDATTRGGIAESATVVDAPAVDKRPQLPRRADAEQPGFFAGAIAALTALLGSVLRAGALIVALASGLVIVGALAIIWVFKQPGMEDTQEALRQALPRDTPGSDVMFASADEAGANRVEQPAAPASQTAVRSDAPSTSPAPPRDPWRGQVPVALRKARSVMLRNRGAGERTLSFLRSYNADHPDDPCGHLLLGGFYLNRKWLSDGVQQYELAFQIDPSARGDEHARRDLLGLASAPDDVWRRARKLLVRTYGRELSADLDQIAKTAQPTARARLLELATEVGQLP